MMIVNDIYNFSFTGAALKFHDFMRLAKYVHEHQVDIDHQTPDVGSPGTELEFAL